MPAVQLAMNIKIAAIHGSSPFSVMFGRRVNAFKNFKNEKENILDSKSHQERIEYMTEVIFPAICDKTRIHQQKTTKAFNSKNLQKEYPQGSYVMAVNNTKNNKLCCGLTSTQHVHILYI